MRPTGFYRWYENEQSLRSRRSRDLTAVGRQCVNVATVVSLGTIALGGWAFHLGRSWEPVPLGLGGLLMLVVRKLASVFKRRPGPRAIHGSPPEP